MSDQLYTLKEVSRILAGAFTTEDAAQCARKVRHWTLMDLLQPFGKKHTGTGTSRQYTAHEVRKAAILMELTHWQVPASLLEDNFDIMLDTYEHSEEWRQAANGEAEVFLILSKSRDVVSWSMAADAPNVSIVGGKDGFGFKQTFVELGSKEQGNGKALTMELPSSAILINVSRIFYRLDFGEAAA